MKISKFSRVILCGLLTCMVFGCVSPNRKDWSQEPLPSEKELDQKVIAELTITSINTGVQGFDGISGRLVEYLLLAHAEMLKKHAERCESEPLRHHLFFFHEAEETVRVVTAPRSVPERWAPPLEGQNAFDERYVFNYIPNSRDLDGCEIEFVIDKESKKVMGTDIRR